MSIGSDSSGQVQPAAGQPSDEWSTPVNRAGFGPPIFDALGVPLTRVPVVSEAPSIGSSVRKTVLVVLLGLLFLGLNVVIPAIMLGFLAVPIVVGVFLCLAFAAAVVELHGSFWLAILSLPFGMFGLSGSLGLASEVALESRGIRQEATIVHVEVERARSFFTLEGDAGPLDGFLVDRHNDSGYQVGDTMTVITDPQGQIHWKFADEVNSRERLQELAIGGISWTVIAVIAGWRGHIRRRESVVRYQEWVASGRRFVAPSAVHDPALLRPGAYPAFSRQPRFRWWGRRR